MVSQTPSGCGAGCGTAFTARNWPKVRSLGAVVTICGRIARRRFDASCEQQSTYTYLPFYSALQNMEMDKLISEVKRRSVLWNRAHSRHGDKVVLDKEWNEVAENTGFTSK